jgi:hypothetical protein
MKSKLFSFAMSGATTDVGAAIDVLGYTRLLLSVFYTSGGTTTLSWQGSHDGTNWFQLTTAAVPAATTLAVELTGFPRYVRPFMVGSTALICTAHVLAK